MNRTTVFHVLDVADHPSLTPAQAKDLLKDLFQCGYETVSDEKAQELLSNINLIQINLINKTLSGPELWRLFEEDPDFGPHQEPEAWMMPGFSMNHTMTEVKKALFARLYPGVDYCTSDINGNN
jgi:hypothetical protein